MFKWQSISFVSRLSAQFVGILQGALILRLLSTQEWGTVQLVLSFAAIIGASQALGLTSGSTREISGAKTNSDAYKVFYTSLILRLAISLPFIIFLYLSADYFSRSTEFPEQVSWALKMISIAMLIDSVRGIFNSVLSGFRKFSTLFTYQIIRAFLSILIYVTLVKFVGFKGYFYAFVLFNLLDAIFLFILAFRNFDNPKIIISLIDFKKVAKDVFGISMVVYLVKTIYSFWESSPNILLKNFLGVPIEYVAIFSLALIYAKKLMVFSDSITDVTLPIMSKRYFEDVEGFKKSYKLNFSVSSVAISLFAGLAIFWSREIVLLYSGNDDFIQSSYLIPFTMLGIWSYSKINLLKSSIFVPAKKLFSLVIVYASILLSTYLLFFTINYLNPNSVLLNFAISFGFGAFIAFNLGVLVVYKTLSIILLGKIEILYFLLTFVYSGIFYLNLSFYNRVFCTFIFILLFLVYFYKQGILFKVYEKITKR